MKKKVLAMVMAAAMMASLSSLAFADDVSKPDTGDGTGNVLVTYDVKSTYTVNIPAAVTFDGTSTTLAPVTASNVIIAGNEKIDVKVTADNGSAGTDLILKSTAGDTINVPLKSDTASYTLGSSLVSFTGDDPAGKALTLDAATATHSGTFTGTLTFTMTISSNP